MGQPFVVSAQNIHTVIGMLLRYAYSEEYMMTINWKRDEAEDEVMYDCSLAVVMLGGTLMNKEDFIDLN